MSRAGKLQRALIIDAWDPDLEVILLLKRCLRMLKVQTSTYVIGKEEYNDFGPIVALIWVVLPFPPEISFVSTALEQCIGSPSRIHHPFASQTRKPSTPKLAKKVSFEAKYRIREARSPNASYQSGPMICSLLSLSSALRSQTSSLAKK